MEWGEKRKLCEKGALLDRPPIRPAPEDETRPSLLTMMSAVLLALNLAMTVYFFDSGLGAVSFVAFLWLDLVLLFYCLRLHNRTATGSAHREHLKLVMWLLTIMLIIAVFTLLVFWFATTMGDMPEKE
jgi:peptidoglycan biosynthesis protein MviN/MurJ (putative lipid II flippase)